MRKFFFYIFKYYQRVCVRLGLKKIPFFRTMINTFDSRVYPMLRPESTTVMGHTMFLDSLDSSRLALHGIYEPYETQLVLNTVKKGDVVIDIGANIGYYTLIFAKLVGENGKVLAFEPDPTNFELLKKNINVNGYHNVDLQQKAVCDQKQKINLFLSDDNKMDHRIIDPKDGRRSIEIDGVSLDEFLPPDQKMVNFIKIDAQGAEFQILKGMSQTLQKNKDLKVIIEFWPKIFMENNWDPLVFFKSLEQAGFSIKLINEGQRSLEDVIYADLVRNNNPKNLFCSK